MLAQHNGKAQRYKSFGIVYYLMTQLRAWCIKGWSYVQIALEFEYV